MKLVQLPVVPEEAAARSEISGGEGRGSLNRTVTEATLPLSPPE